VEVKIFPDRLVITNPGTLMPGLTVEELRHDPHPSRRRNPLIAEVAAIDYWVERAGTGTTRMIKVCRGAGLPAPTFENRSSGFIVEFLRDPWTEERLARLGLNERQLLAMSHVRTHGSIRLKEHRALTGAPERTAARDLRELAERGLLNKEGAGAATRYVLGSLPTLP
jgi:ATP-dependent DNA helicase RecG